MNSIYNFEEHTPPKLTEQMLQAELNRRALHRQTKLLRLAALLVSLCLLLFSAMIFPYSPFLSLAGSLFVVLWLAGSSIIGLVFFKTGLLY